MGQTCTHRAPWIVRGRLVIPADTLLVAAAGGGLAIAGSFANQARQHGYEHERWKRERMEQAVVHYAELAARTQRVLHISSWADSEDAPALIDEADTLTGELDDSMASLHLAFGIDSPVTEFAEVVRDGLRNALDVRIRLLRDGLPVGDSDEWIGARQDFDELMQEIGLRRMEFTEAARAELFLPPRYKHATRWRRKPRAEPQ
jgi:hypothetical protein